MRRQKLITEIWKHAGELGINKSTLLFVLANLTDKALSVFHKEFMAKTK